MGCRDRLQCCKDLSKCNSRAQKHYYCCTLFSSEAYLNVIHSLCVFTISRYDDDYISIFDSEKTENQLIYMVRERERERERESYSAKIIN